MSGMTNDGLRAPFPWYGGKRRVAPEVWAILGDVKRYIEPFAGSLGVLLGRPEPFSGIEVVNDLDGYVVNAWRAIRAAPEETARIALEPITELDLTAKHLWLVNEGKNRLHAGMIRDPDFFDAKVAGWWLQGIACWIGTGFCAGTGPWTHDAMTRIIGDGLDGQGVHRKLPHLGNDGRGVHRQLPHLGNDGRGVHRQLPHLGDDGRGVHRKLPHLGNDGRGVHRQLPHLGNDGRGVEPTREEVLAAYMRALGHRLKHVVVANGDWSRCVSSSALGDRTIPSIGVFLDPPYRGFGDEYATRGTGVDELWDKIEAWTRGDQANAPNVRVILCGYSGDFTMPIGWSEIAYVGKGTSSANRDRERFWLNPSATAQHERNLRATHEELELF